MQPAPITISGPAPPARPASKVFYHRGIGGAGNYHKHNSFFSDSSSPRQHNRTHLPRSLLSIFSSGSSQSDIIEEEDFARPAARVSRGKLRRFAGIGGGSSRGKGNVLRERIGEVEEEGSGFSAKWEPHVGGAEVLKWRLGAMVGMRKVRDE